MTTETTMPYEQWLRMMQDQYNGDSIELARAIEQAVLNSPEVQALRKDAAMLDWMISQEAQMQSMDRSNGGNVMYRVGWPDDGEYMAELYSCPREAISAAMEQQT